MCPSLAFFPSRTSPDNDRKWRKSNRDAAVITNDLCLSQIWPYWSSPKFSGSINMLSSRTPKAFRIDDDSGQMKSAHINMLFIMLPCTHDHGVTCEERV